MTSHRPVRSGDCVEFHRGFTEDPVAIVVGQRSDQTLRGSTPGRIGLVVRRGIIGEMQYRPITAPHQSAWSERVDQNLYIRLQRLCGPAALRLRRKSRELAEGLCVFRAICRI